MLNSVKYVLFILFFISTLTKCSETEMTVNIGAGREDCFFQSAQSTDSVEIEYQVIDGGHGDLDITFHLVSPTGRILAADYKKSENNHRVVAVDTGDYKFCFDNTFSTYNIKTIYFEIIIEKEGEQDEDEWDNDVRSTYEYDPEDVINLSIKDIKEIVGKVHNSLREIRHLQDVIKSTEARDRNVAEENYFIVNAFSYLQIFVMLFVGFVQVFMVQSLFDDKSRVHNIWKNIPFSR